MAAKKPVPVRLDGATLRAVDREAENRGVTRAWVLRAAIEDAYPADHRHQWAVTSTGDGTVISSCTYHQELDGVHREFACLAIKRERA